MSKTLQSRRIYNPSYWPPSTAVAAEEVLLQAVRTVCCVYKKYFRNSYETHKLQGGGDLGESIDLLLFNSSYNLRRWQYFRDIYHNVFCADNKDAFCNFAGYVLKREGHGNIFCLAVQFAF